MSELTNNLVQTDTPITISEECVSLEDTDYDFSPKSVIVKSQGENLLPQSWLDTTISDCQLTSDMELACSSNDCGDLIVRTTYCQANGISPCTYVSYKQATMGQEFKFRFSFVRANGSKMEYEIARTVTNPCKSADSYAEMDEVVLH